MALTITGEWRWIEGGPRMSKGRTHVMVCDAEKLSAAVLIDGGGIGDGVTDVGAMKRYIADLENPEDIGLDGREVAFVRVVERRSSATSGVA